MSLHTPTKQGYSVNDLIGMYGLSRMSIYAEINSGRLPSVKVSGRRMVLESGRLEWEESIKKDTSFQKTVSNNQRATSNKPSTMSKAIAEFNRKYES